MFHNCLKGKESLQIRKKGNLENTSGVFWKYSETLKRKTTEQK